ncbi:MAG: hypothetical protein ACI87E_000657 [Mariniblastus sp.]
MSPVTRLIPTDHPCNSTDDLTHEIVLIRNRDLDC